MKQLLLLVVFIGGVLFLFRPPIDEMEFVIPSLKGGTYQVTTPLFTMEVPYFPLCELVYPAVSLSKVITVDGMREEEIGANTFSKLATSIIPASELEQKGYCHLLLLRGRGIDIDVKNDMYTTAKYDLKQELGLSDKDMDTDTPWTSLVKSNTDLIRRIYLVYGSKPLGLLESFNQESTIFKVRSKEGEVRYLYGYASKDSVVRVLDPLYPNNLNYTLDLSTMTYRFRIRTYYVKEMYQ